MCSNNILGIKIGEENIPEILEKIDHYLNQENKRFFHIANLNPDLFVLAHKDKIFRNIINDADFILIDGIGIKIAAGLFRVKSGERMTGTDFMQILVKIASEKDWKVMFLGGKDNTAEKTGLCLKKQYSRLKYVYDSGAKDIIHETREEKNRVLKIINKFHPNLLFAAYGSPYQEKWIVGNAKYLEGIVCMGVGGSFNFFAGRKKRSPKIVSKYGFEWLWRFILEPYRLISRLPRYCYFCFLILYNRIYILCKE